VYYCTLKPSQPATISWYYTPHSSSQLAKNFFMLRTAPISWWDRRFACHRRPQPALGCGYAAVLGGQFCRSGLSASLSVIGGR
jgi:hypothetical protein